MDAEKLSQEQEEELVRFLHQGIVSDLSFTEAISLVSNVVLDQVKKNVAEMTDEQKNQAYQDINLK